MPTEFSLAKNPFYFVTDHNFTGGRPQLEIVKAALEGGIRFVQYRDKNLSDPEFEMEAKAILAACHQCSATLIINDRVAIAKSIGADGVHLGQDDISPTVARKILGPHAIIGLSTHNQAEVLAAENQPVDYINIGPMFPTSTKDHSQYPALGTEGVLELSRLSHHPITTMGGIKKAHLKNLFQLGIQTVAMVTEISQAQDPASRVRELLSQVPGAQH
jgi:thiamine-phosphate pyrophosphorylase